MSVFSSNCCWFQQPTTLLEDNFVGNETCGHCGHFN